jgi:tetratricopeptide (TPR) repeat protein
MAIKGSLKEASLPDVLQLLSMGKKTGCLSVTHRNNFGYIYFDKGRISYASVVNRRDRLGDMLVKSGAVTRRALEEAVSLQDKRRDKRLGELLMESGAITLQQLYAAIDIQIREAVYYLFTWNQGTFNFDADVTPDASEHVVSINPESLLLEGARRVDEWSLIEKKIPTFDLVFEVDRTKSMVSEVELTEEQTVVLELIDGKRDLQGIVDASGLVEFEVGKALYGLMTAGFVHKVGRTSPSTTVLPENRADEHMNLGVAFYKTGMLDESIREFRRVVELRTGGRGGDRAARFYIGLALSRQGKWTEAAATFSDCVRDGAGSPHPAVLHNLAYALEQQQRYDEARAALDEAISHGGADDPRIHTSLGVLNFLIGDLAAASMSFRTARPLFGTRPPTPAWFHHAALAAALSGDIDGAAKILSDGVATHPHAAVLLNNLAVVLERRGDADAALATAERALNEDASIAQLHKNLGDLRYRAARYDEALDSYMRATKMNPDLGADVYLRIGNIRLRRQERVEAVRCWERALELDPSNAIVRTNLESVRQVF